MSNTLRIEITEEGDDYTVTRSGTFKKGSFSINRTWKDMKLDDLKPILILGHGSSGVVYKAIHKMRPSLQLALKDISVCDENKRNTIIKELEALHTAQCPHLVGFFGAFYSDSNVSLALEYMEGGSLKDIYEMVGPIDEAVLALITYQVLLGLRYLHKDRHVIHRDIKPSNVLMNKHGEFKITDFGVSAELDHTFEQCATFVGTMTYMSPERLTGERYSFECDIWSLGVSIVECATGRFPFVKQDGTAPINGFWELLHHIKSQDPPSLSTKDGFSPEISDFVAQCLSKDPNSRASVVELLSHPFIQRNVPENFPKQQPDRYTVFTRKALELAEQREASENMNLQNDLERKEKLLANLQF